MNALFRLKKLAGRRSWTSNLSGAEPASWQVKSADIFLIGYSGAVPYYRLIVGGKFNGMEVEGGQDIRTLYSFADAKKAAKKAYLEQQSSTAEIDAAFAQREEDDGCRHDWAENEESGRTYCLNCGADGDA